MLKKRFYLTQINISRLWKIAAVTPFFFALLLSVGFSYSAVFKEVVSQNIRGEISADNAAPFLEQAHQQRILTLPDFEDKKCLQAFGNYPHITVKSSCSGNEYNLIAVDQAAALQITIGIENPQIGLLSYAYPNRVNGFPLFVFPLAYMFYTDNGQKHYLYLVGKPSGKALSEYLTEYWKNVVGLSGGTSSLSANVWARSDSSPILKDLRKIYRSMGMALSNLYKTFLDSNGKVDWSKMGNYAPRICDMLYDEQKGTVIFPSVLSYTSTPNLSTPYRVAKFVRDDMVRARYTDNKKALSHLVNGVITTEPPRCSGSYPVWDKILKNTSALASCLNLTVFDSFIDGFLEPYTNASEKQSVIKDIIATEEKERYIPLESLNRLKSMLKS